MLYSGADGVRFVENILFPRLPADRILLAVNIYNTTLLLHFNNNKQNTANKEQNKSSEEIRFS